MMWYNIFKFELKYRARRPETYVFFVFLLLFSVVGVDFIFQGVELGLMKKNSPLVIGKTMGAISGIFMIMVSLIMGVPVLRDFQYNFTALLFVNPIKKRDYLLGRFLGSFTVLLFIFSGIIIGMILGQLMPWHKEEEMLAFQVLSYIQTFLVIVIPILFFGSALFFISGSLSKKLLVVYTQGIFMFVIFMLTKAIKNDYLQAIFDPFSLTTLTQVTRDWSVEVRNSTALSFQGVLLHNKLFWMLLGVLILSIGYRKFSYTVKRNTKKKSRKSKVEESEIESKHKYTVPTVLPSNGLKTWWAQFLALSRFYTKSLLKETSFWAIVICGMVIILINSVSLGTVYGVDSFPATYFIVEELQESSIYFFIILLIFYSGELIWKEREAKISSIYDATPISDFIALASKFIALTAIYVVLMLSLILTGILFQLANGYYAIDIKVYFFGFFVEILPYLMLYTFIAFFFQVLFNRKFVGIIMILVFFIINIASEFFGFQHSLYKFGGKGLGSYSEMNGYGHFLTPYLWVKAYWFVFGIIVLLAASLISVRGNEAKLVKRINASKHRFTPPLKRFGGIAIIVFILLGTYIFYNTNVLNAYWTSSEKTTYRANYEKTLKQFEYLPQPKITAINLNLELYPKKRAYSVEGEYILKNTQDVDIQEIHIQKLIEVQVKLEQLSFDREFTSDMQYEQFDYRIYRLEQPLKPGDSLTMMFKQTSIPQGFEEGSSNTNMVNNGTFLNHKNFPTLGYNKRYELEDEDDRSIHDLSPRLEKARRGDAHEMLNGRSGSDAHGMRFNLIVSTDATQKAVSSGNLIKQWKENKRNYFQYQTNQPIIDFYSIVSAKYEVLKDTWKPKIDALEAVDLEIYYHKAHGYNIDRMMNSMKHSLAYFSANFSPYQYEQLRIMEFPRYAEFAQSFPTMIPFSEALGFVLDIDDENDVDMVYYITAHEVAHQWWGMQVEAANVQGRNMILETLSQYSAMMVLQKHYPNEKVQQFLGLQEEIYDRDRKKSKVKEPALAVVENQEHIYYNKGALVMFKLMQEIGEDHINRALARFIEDWDTHRGALKTKTDRYATTYDLLNYLRAETPDNLKYLIHELFETTSTKPILVQLPLAIGL